MNYGNFKTGFNKESKFTAEHYGTKVSVEYDHSDLNFDEVMDAFETLVQGMGWHKDAWKDWIIERAAEYQEEENEKWDEDGGFGTKPYTYEDFKRDEENAVRNVIKSKLDMEKFSDSLENPPLPNGVLIDAKKQYDEQMKKKDNPKQFNGIESKEPFVKTRKKKKKTVQDWEDEFELGGHE